MVQEKKALFKKIIQELPLLETHREALRTNRGFSDEVIDTLKFRSTSKSILENSDFLQSLPSEFKDSFKYENIIIPYLMKNGSSEPEIIHIRPHKFGIEGLSISPYIPYDYIGNDHKRLVIAESEFKAIASCLYGVPAIGLPGIASCSDKRFNLLIDILRSLQTQEVVICFDNEIKDNPKLSNFKPDFRKRYDTQFYAYLMARKISEEAKINTKVAVLNKSWMKDGKVDIDGMLASGIPKEAYHGCIRNCVDFTTYKNSWEMPRAHRQYIERRIDKYFYDGPIYEHNKCYYARGTNKGAKQLSNFLMKVVHTMYSDEGKAERICRFVSKYGDSGDFPFATDYMVSSQQFQKVCYENGDFEFYGKDEELKALWRYLFVNQDGRIVKKLSYYGYNEDLDAWFFANGAYKDDVFYEIDENGIVWMDDIGYKLLENVNELDIPTLSSDRTENINVTNIYQKLSVILDKNEARLLLGWSLGNFFLPEILKKYKIYPFMFMFGKMGSGKSTISNWASAFFGFTQNGINFHSTNVGISRITCQMSCIPVWLEEYRNKDKDIGKKNNFLRSIYDRSTIVKGSKKETEIKSYKAKSTLIISGEEHPQDAALNSRCVQFPIYRDSESVRSNSEYLWMQNNRTLFSEIGDQILKSKQTLWPKIEDRIDSYIGSFQEKLKISDRQKIQMSIIAGVCDNFIEKSEDFSVFVGEKAERQDKKVHNEQALYVFFEDVLNMYVSKKFKTKIIERKIVDNKDVVLFWFSMAYSDWEVYYRGLRNDIPASKEALTEHIRSEPYYLGARACRLGSSTVHSMMFDWEHPKLNESIRSMVLTVLEDPELLGKMNFEYAD